MIRKIIVLLSAIVMLAACTGVKDTSSLIKITVSDKFSGPVLIFLHDGPALEQGASTSIDTFGIKNLDMPITLSITPEVYDEKGVRIQEIEIGKEDQVADSQVGVFQLIDESYFAPECNNGKTIYIVSFYKGTKAQYDAFRKQYKPDVVEYFTRNNVDWCSIFKQGGN